MAFLQNLSDDQIAILGCCGALAVSFGLMMVSFHFGRLVRGERAIERAENVPPAGASQTAVDPQERRRAA